MDPEPTSQLADLADRLAARAGLEAIWEQLRAGARLGAAEGLHLYRSWDLAAVGALAEWRAVQLHGRKVFFNVNQHINYSNICARRCRFCAFHRRPDQDGAYALSPDEVAERVRSRLGEPITEIHMVGGIHPDLPYEYYLELLRAVKDARPEVHIKAFTMVEIDHLQRLRGRPLPELFAELRDAGLGSLPGGGAEVFSRRVQRELFPTKIGAERWLELSRAAHDAGLRSNATLLFGHVESLEERVDHLLRLRTLQDETGGLQAFIPLAFHPANTGLSDLPGPTAVDALRTIAVARLLLDNVPHIKAYWVMLSLPVAQMALTFGADDIDGTVTEERITHDAGATTPAGISRPELERLIRDVGRVPIERDTLYNEIAS